MTEFTQKKIDITFQLGKGRFGTDGFDTVKLSGLRVQVDIQKAGGIFKGALNLRIFGMTLDMMNRLSHIGRIATSVQQNLVTVEAGDDVIGMANIYQGSIYQAWADFNGMPEVAFTVEAQAGYFQSVQSTPPSSYKGSIDAAIVMNNLAQRMGMNFENNGVSRILTNPYYSGSLTEQVEACAREARFDFTYDTINTLAIWPSGGYRQQPNKQVPIIGPGSGLVGYPRFNQTGITLVTEFDPRVTMSALIEVKSSLSAAEGTWRVNQMAISLESNNPSGGPWFTTLECAAIDRIVLPR